MDGWIGRRIDKNVWIDRGDGWTNRRMDGKMGKWIDGWMDG